MKISQDLARRIALKLTDKKHNQVEKLLKAYRQLVTDFYRLSTPEDVLICYKKYPDYFEKESYIRFEGHGFRREVVNVIGEYVIANCNRDAWLKLTPEIADTIKKAKSEWEDCKNECDKLLQETNNALLALGTYKKIEEFLPEAAKYLPQTGQKVLALIPNLDKLKDKLQNQVK